jgi:hypothetical protein
MMKFLADFVMVVCEKRDDQTALTECEVEDPLFVVTTSIGIR